MRLTQAVVRRPGPNFADGITTAGLGAPDIALALAQHEGYVRALRDAGLRVTQIPVEDRHPDGCFVEDAAIVTGAGAILTRPGAAVRRGEVGGVRDILATLVPILGAIEPPGLLDGGDVCDAGGHTFIGLSGRTDDSGASQLAVLLSRSGYPATIVDLREISGLLHLKSGLSHLGENRLAAIASLARLPCFRDFDIVEVRADEAYAANAIRVNEDLLIASGFPAFEAQARSLGYRVVVLDMSEFRKLDGGLSCLSLRF